MGKTILETQRLLLREMAPQDEASLGKMLKDAEVMTYYEHEFTDSEVTQWLQRQMDRYETDGFGLWAVCKKDTGEMIGQCGITWQEWDGARIPEVGYLFQKAYWHQGYAIEAAVACRDYAFDTLGFDVVYSIIRDTNTPSQKVAVRNGMCQCGSKLVHYYDIEMPHLVFCVKKPAVKEG